MSRSSRGGPRALSGAASSGAASVVLAVSLALSLLAYAPQAHGKPASTGPQAAVSTVEDGYGIRPDAKPRRVTPALLRERMRAARASASSTDATTQAFVCDHTFQYYLMSTAELRLWPGPVFAYPLVSAEYGYTGGNYGMLRARALDPGPWERFYLCDDSASDYYALKSYQTGLFVQVEYDYPGGDDGMLRAVGDSIGYPEQFLFVPTTEGGWALYSRTTGKYVATEISYTDGRNSMLRARASQIGPWENFELFSW